MTRRTALRFGVVAGVDVGGTFTDAVALDLRTGSLAVAKATTTPRAPVEGLLAALAATGVELSQVSRLFHGTTLGLNTALERSGATVGLIASEGCRDVLEIGRMSWPMYALHTVLAAPLVPRYLRREIPERVTSHGDVVTDFTDADVIEAVHRLLADGAEVVAVTLMHSYAHPHNEKRVGAVIEEHFPGLAYSLSHEVACEYREYERSVTTVVEATTKPKLGKYFADLHQFLVERGFTGELFITRSDGGLMSVAEARNSCVQTLVSGPASGIAGAAELGSRIGVKHILTIDVGGTSFDAALIRDGKPVLQAMTDITGLPRLLMPSIEIATIGAGGGSVAWIDAAGTLNVGPRSAGAEPGPVCYGRGGTEPTFTDAALVCGLLDPDSFLGGTMSLDKDAAIEAIRTRIAEPLTLGVEEAAGGIVALAEVKMAHKLDEITIEKGIDPRELTMVVYGGGGPLAADALASRVGIARVVVPPSAGMFSAGGALTLDVAHSYSQTVVHALDVAGMELLRNTVKQLEATALDKLEQDDIDPSRRRLVVSVDLRYDLQEHSLTVPIEDGVDPLTSQWLETAFHDAHQASYGYRLDEPIELVACRVRGIGLLDKATVAPDELGGRDCAHAFRGARTGIHRESGGTIEFAVYDRRVLRPGNELAGPALVEEDSTTTLVLPGRRATVDEYSNLVITDTPRPTDSTAPCSSRFTTDHVTEQMDPITLTVIRRGVLAAAEEMRSMFKRAATLAILYEFNDYGISILDDKFNLLADAPGIPIFLGSLDTCLEATVAEMGGVEAFEPSDVMLNNHPYLTAGQPPDAVVAEPIFVDGQVIGYCALRAHMGDVGGKGMYPVDTTELFQEGTILPGVKIVHDGAIDDTILRILRANSRLPSETVGNVLAAVSAVHVGTGRILDLVGRYGLAAYRAAIAKSLDDSEVITRRAIAAIPDGTYSLTDYLDNNGVEDAPVKIGVDVTVSGSEITVDLSRSAGVQVGPINCPRGYTLATVRLALKRVLCPDAVPTSGEHRPMTVIAPVGSLFNPESPAPCFIGAWSSVRMGDMLVLAMAQALPGRVPAGCGGDLVQCDVWMTNPETNRTHIFGDTGGLGTGAFEGYDGMNGVVHNIIAGCEIIPAEMIENRIRILRRRMAFVTDSGGAGRFRGGLGVVTEQEFMGPGFGNVVAEKTNPDSPVLGLDGGHNAPYNNAITLFPGTDRELRLGKKSPIPVDEGDRMIVLAAGGGGYGDPLERAPESVVVDVRNGYVSSDAARDLYGVVLDTDTWTVDAGATASRRGELQ